VRIAERCACHGFTLLFFSFGACDRRGLPVLVAFSGPPAGDAFAALSAAFFCARFAARFHLVPPLAFSAVAFPRHSEVFSMRLRRVATGQRFERLSASLAGCSPILMGW